MEKKVMTKEDIENKLIENGLSDYIELFEKNHLFDIDVLKMMTNEDYSSIGISIIGDRKKLIKIFSEVQSENNSKNEEPENFGRIGDKVYKEVQTPDGKVGKWLQLYEIRKYNFGKLISEEFIRDERIILYEYNSNNLLTCKKRVEDGSKYIYEYNNKGELIHEEYISNENSVKLLPFASSLGFPSLEIFYEYDSKGNLIYIKNITDDVQTYEQKYEYDSNNKKIAMKERYSFYDETSDEEEIEYLEEHYDYDSKNNLIHIERSARKLPFGVMISGKKIPLEEFFEYDLDGNLIRKFDELGNEKLYEYHNSGKLLTKIKIEKNNCREITLYDENGLKIYCNYNGRESFGICRYDKEGKLLERYVYNGL